MAMSPLFIAARRGGMDFDPFVALETLFATGFTDDIDDLDLPLQLMFFGNPIVDSMQVNWKETPEAHIYQANVPAGLKKEVIKLHIEEKKVLSLSGEHGLEERGSHDDWESYDDWETFERSYGSFMKQLSLPENANTEDMTASVENGVLTIKVPKARSSTPVRRAIKLS